MLGSRLRAGAAISPFGSGRTVIPHFYDQSGLVGLKNTSFPSSRTGFCPTMSLSDFAMSGAEEFCQHDFFYLPTSLRAGMVFS